jgi:hypothetical protein
MTLVNKGYTSLSTSVAIQNAIKWRQFCQRSCCGSVDGTVLTLYRLAREGWGCGVEWMKQKKS